MMKMMRMLRLAIALPGVAGIPGIPGAVVAAALLTSCRSTEEALHVAEAPVVESPALDDTSPREYHGLHNVVAYYHDFYSGSVPEGDAGFDTLLGLGVRTIISVDGAAPEIEEARERGIRYIHLPISYNGFDEQRKRELVRATRDALAEGPVYIHCHHGKHRSAGAAGAITASLGWATPEDMVERMKVSGTSPSYKGLYACTAETVVIPVNIINALPADFPEVSRPTGYVKGMVEMDMIHEHLKAIEKANWDVPADHPDLVPVAEAGRMADLFRVLCETEYVKSKPADFTEMMHESNRVAQRLEDMLESGNASRAQMSAVFKELATTCKACHEKYRD